jgi:hypothetical protein
VRTVYLLDGTHPTWPRRVAVVQRTVTSAGTYFPVAPEIVQLRISDSILPK